jgi:hypothetical protein
MDRGYKGNMPVGFEIMDQGMRDGVEGTGNAAYFVNRKYCYGCSGKH